MLPGSIPGGIISGFAPLPENLWSAQRESWQSPPGYVRIASFG
jgi:hypothetical protein